MKVQYFDSPLSEEVLLSRFWGDLEHNPDRIAHLRRFAVLRVRRPADWSTEAVRAATLPPYPSQCFCCYTGDRVLDWHHIIAVNHGGDSLSHNLVAICKRCHADVHPWLPREIVRRNRWWSARELVGVFIDKLERLFNREIDTLAEPEDFRRTRRDETV